MKQNLNLIYNPSKFETRVHFESPHENRSSFLASGFRFLSKILYEIKSLKSLYSSFLLSGSNLVFITDLHLYLSAVYYRLDY